MILFSHGGLLNQHIIGQLTHFAPVQQTQTINLLFKFDKCSVEATSHVVETGGKQSEIVKCFLQHVTPVPESESFKPGQEHMQQTTQHNSSERINMILKIAKSQANDLPAEARASLRQKRKEMDRILRIEYEVERSDHTKLDLLDKTTFIDRQEQIRTKQI
jgi:hypothetical protein